MTVPRCWISSYMTYPYQEQDDMYQLAKECSHGRRKYITADESANYSISSTRTAYESNYARMLLYAVRVVSSLAFWLSVVPFRWTTIPTLSHCALGRAVGKRLYVYTLVQSYQSHTTASTCRILASTTIIMCVMNACMCCMKMAG